MNVSKPILIIALLLLSSCSRDTWMGAAKKVDIVGERIPLVQVDKDLTVNPKLSSKSMKIADPENNQNWTQGSGILSYIPSNITVAPNFQKPTKFQVNGNSSFHTGTTPIIDNGVLYAVGNDGVIKAYSTTSGSEIWQNNYFHELERKSIFDFFGSYFICGSMSISNGIIFATAGIAEVIAVDAATGSTVWISKLSSPSRSAPVIVNNKVIIQTIDNKVFALDINSGEILWNHFGVGEEISILSASAPATDGKKIIVQYTTGELFALDSSNGQETWMESVSPPIDSGYSLGSVLNVVTSPYLDSTSVIAFGNDGILVSLDQSNGVAKWKKELGIVKPFWVSGDSIFAVNRSNKLLCIDKTSGDVRWMQELKSETPARYTSPIIVNSEVIVISSEGELLKFDPSTGTLNSSQEVEKQITLQPIVVEGSIYVSTTDGSITKY